MLPKNVKKIVKASLNGTFLNEERYNNTYNIIMYIQKPAFPTALLNTVGNHRRVLTKIKMFDRVKAKAPIGTSP